MKFFKEKFRELRKANRWTTKALAAAANLSRESISKWENGQREPSAKSIYLLATTIGIRVSEISDLEDLYPKSEQKVSETIVTDNCNLIETISSQEDSYLNNILANLKKMNSNLKRVSEVLKTILLNVNNIIYIKDIDQKYVLVSKAFLDNCSLDVNFISKGKGDDDFFPQKEAMLNTKEDEEIFSTGEGIVNFERHIPGSRKKKWGIFSKVPILDNEKKIKGLLCVIVDITERRKEEKYSKILEYAMAQSKTSIWVGRDLDLSNTPMLSKDIIYWRRSESDLFWGDTALEDHTDSDLNDIWYKSITEKTKAKFINEKKSLKFPLTRSYFVKSPFTGERIWMKEMVFYDEEHETLVGLITEDSDSLKLNILSNVIESMSNIIVWSGNFDTESKFKYSYLNDTKGITGYDPDDFLNNKISFKSLTVNEHKELFDSLNENTDYPISFEFKILDKSNNEHWFKGNFFRNRKSVDYDIDAYFGYYIDISEEKYLEESLRDMKFKELGID